MLYLSVVIFGVLNAENSITATKLTLEFSKKKIGLQRENCEVSCAIWEEIFEDIDDTLKDLKDTDDNIKVDLTRKVFLTLKACIHKYIIYSNRLT